jgi:hypothetical protein
VSIERLNARLRKLEARPVLHDGPTLDELVRADVASTLLRLDPNRAHADELQAIIRDVDDRMPEPNPDDEWILDTEARDIAKHEAAGDPFDPWYSWDDGGYLKAILASLPVTPDERTRILARLPGA